MTMDLVRSIATRLHRSPKAPVRLTTREGERLEKGEIGLLGEKLAARHLRSVGYKLLYRNFRAVEGGEVDIVCRHGRILAFVEVKTRTSTKFGRPIDAVTMDKRYLITRGAMEWLRLLDWEEGKIRYRFDVVEVLLSDGERPDFTLVQDAFQTPQPFIYG